MRQEDALARAEKCSRFFLRASRRPQTRRSSCSPQLMSKQSQRRYQGCPSEPKPSPDSRSSCENGWRPEATVRPPPAGACAPPAAYQPALLVKLAKMARKRAQQLWCALCSRAMPRSCQHAFRVDLTSCASAYATLGELHLDHEHNLVRDVRTAIMTAMCGCRHSRRSRATTRRTGPMQVLAVSRVTGTDPAGRWSAGSAACR